MENVVGPLSREDGGALRVDWVDCTGAEAGIVTIGDIELCMLVGCVLNDGGLMLLIGDSLDGVVSVSGTLTVIVSLGVLSSDGVGVRTGVADFWVVKNPVDITSAAVDIASDVGIAVRAINELVTWPVVGALISVVVSLPTRINVVIVSAVE
jgi:hypothetical protein